MRVKLALSAAVASLLFSAPVLAQNAAPAPQDAVTKCERKQAKMGRRLERMQHRLDRAVQRGRLSQAQADTFKAEARQIQEELRSQLKATSCQLSEAQREQFKARKQALREKVKGVLKDSKDSKDHHDL